MSKFVSMLAALVMTLFASSAMAFVPPPTPAQGGYVLDQTGRMSADDIQSLNHKIDAISKATKNEFGCLLLQDMGGETIEEVAGSTFRAWGIGKHGLDNGILIVVALKEHKSRIETGKGVEGEVTDLQASDILKNNLNPHLKRGDFVGGFNNALDALSGLLESRAGQVATPVPSPATASVADNTSFGSSMGWYLIFGVVLVSAGIGLTIFLSGRAADRKRQKEEEERERLRQRTSSLNYPHTIPKRSPASFSPPVDDTTFITAAVVASTMADTQSRTPVRKQEERRKEETRRRSDDDSSSSSSFDWGGSSTSSDSGGGFGGGDSGGGGSSSDW